MTARIDVHHHFFPPAFLAAAGEIIRQDAPDYQRILDWQPGHAVEAMDRSGIAMAIVSVPPPCTLGLGPAAAAALARACNDFGRRMRDDFPGRFRQFAMLPLPFADLAVAEMVRAFDELDVAGIAVLTSYDGEWLGDTAYAPVLEELDRRGGIVHVHPFAAPVQPRLPAATLEFPFDTTRAIANYLVGGAAARFPRVRPIFSHGGGALSALIPRLETLIRMKPDAAAAVPEGVRPTLGRFFYDVTFAALPHQLAALTAIVPATQLLFGSDLPFLPAEATLAQLGDPGNDDELRRAIDRANAVDLFQLDP